MMIASDSDDDFSSGVVVVSRPQNSIGSSDNGTKASTSGTGVEAETSVGGKRGYFLSRSKSTASPSGRTPRFFSAGRRRNVDEKEKTFDSASMLQPGVVEHRGGGADIAAGRPVMFPSSNPRGGRGSTPETRAGTPSEGGGETSVHGAASSIGTGSGAGGGASVKRRSTAPTRRRGMGREGKDPTPLVGGNKTVAAV
jgi:hypothetical protein